MIYISLILILILLASLLVASGFYNLHLKNTLRLERQVMSDRIDWLEAAKKSMTEQFQHLASDVLVQNAQKMTHVQEDKLIDILKPFEREMAQFKTDLQKRAQYESDQRTSLQQEVKTLYHLNQKMTQETTNLTKALKGDVKKQGIWGEMVLERILEASGLRKGVEYTKEVVLRNEDQKMYRPDFIVHLPDQKDVIIDSKVSLVHYESYVNAQNDVERIAFLKQHVNSVKKHIQGLANKRYEDLEGVNTLDFVLLFVPIESAFILAFESDNDLFYQAFDQKVVVVTASTLLATLGTIKNTWRYEQQSQNIQDITRHVANMLDKFRGFVDEMAKVDQGLNKARVAYDEAMNKLSKGKGNLVSRALKIQDLGIKMKKPLSVKLMEEEVNDEVNI